MPELPEVETIARSLRNTADLTFKPKQALNERPGVIGRKVNNAEVTWMCSIAIPDGAAFTSRICGQTILDVQRRGKFLVFQLDRDWLLMHLRMSGDIRVELQEALTIQRHDRVTFNFEDGSRMVLNDTRKFGRVWLVEDKETILGELGPEPLSEELTREVFFTMLQQHKTGIKSLLLDQHFIAGMGNIYTDEALHLAGIHPLQKAMSLTPERAGRLLEAIRSVLYEGIRRNGVSIDWVYRGGDFQNYLKVYQRTGEACLVCGSKIERITVGQRGTHYCPCCQSLTTDRYH
jgi:formamidopyrimidine-DNA glycosylase